MTVLSMTDRPQITELVQKMMGLTSNERLLLARVLLDSVLTKEIDEESDWQNLSLSTFEADWDNDEDAIYDNWRQLYGVPAR